MYEVKNIKGQVTYKDKNNNIVKLECDVTFYDANDLYITIKSKTPFFTSEGCIIDTLTYRPNWASIGKWTYSNGNYAKVVTDIEIMDLKINCCLNFKYSHREV